MRAMNNRLRQISEISGISIEQIQGDCRKHEIVCCRALFAYLCEKERQDPSVYCKFLNKDRSMMYRYSDKIYYAPQFKELLKKYKEKYNADFSN